MIRGYLLILLFSVNTYANIFQLNQTIIETSPIQMTCIQNKKSLLLQMISVPDGQQCQIGMEIKAAPTEAQRLVQFKVKDSESELNANGAFQLFRQDLKTIYIDVDSFKGQFSDNLLELVGTQFQCFRNQNKDPLKQCLDQTQVVAKRIHYLDKNQNVDFYQLGAKIESKLARFQMQKLRSQQDEKTTDFVNMTILRKNGIMQMPTDDLLNLIDFFLQKIEVSIGQIQTVSSTPQFLKAETEALGMFEIDKIYDIYVDITQKNFTFTGKYRAVMSPKIDVRGTAILDRKKNQLVLTITKSKIGIVPVTYLVPFILKRAVNSPRMKVSGNQIFISLQ